MTLPHFVAGSLILPVAFIVLWVNPKHGTWQKWVYWLLAPLLATVGIGLGSGDMAEAFAFSPVVWIVLAGMYFRYGSNT